MNVDKLLDISNSHIHFPIEDTGGLNTNFLDTNIQIQNNSFIVTPYVKPTDTRLYVLSDSCHPTHQKTSIAYSQSLRLIRICTRTEDYNTHTDLLKSALERRGYTTPNIDTAIEKARCLNRSDLIQPSSARKNPDDHKTIFCYNFPSRPQKHQGHCSKTYITTRPRTQSNNITHKMPESGRHPRQS